MDSNSLCGEITVDEMVEAFRENLEKGLRATV